MKTIGMEDGPDETREITIEVESLDEDWLGVVANDYRKSPERAAGELVRYGLIHHEEALDR